jgi:hypothetical protein
LRNSARWKSLLPLAAGTGRELEQERLKIILDWMWGTVLPSVQLLADQQGFGAQWQKMTAERTAESATEAAVRVVGVAAVMAGAAAWAAEAARATASAASAAAWAAREAQWAAAAAGAEAWANFDPCGLLERLVNYAA